MSLSAEIQKLAPSAVIELFELDLTDLGDQVYRFHAGTNELSQNIVWNGETYTRFPVQAEGFDLTGNGQIPRPRLSVSNVFGSITALILTFGDLLGAKLTRRRTLAKYLDAVNFAAGNALADPTAEFPADVYIVDRKVSEARDAVVFELAAPFDLAGIALPRRQIIQNTCPFKYRGTECGYAGTNYFDTSDEPVATQALDRCGKRLSSCKARFGEVAQLPFGGFPGAGLFR